MTNSDKRIAFFLPNLEMGGAERVLLQLAAGFNERGYEVDFVLVQAKGALLNQLPTGVRLVNLQASSEYTCLPGLVRYLRHNRPVALLSTMILSNWIALLAGRLAGAPVRVVVRAATTLSRQWRSSTVKKLFERLLVKTLYPLASGIIAVSQGVADDLVSYTGLSTSQITVIPNPVVTGDLAEKAARPVEHPWFEAGLPPVVLAAGRLAPEKDYASLLRAFALVQDEKPARLVILGEGEQRAELEALALSLGISAQVSLPGFVENPSAYMSKAAVFVLSSRWEGLPNALIQALACGCPVVSTDCLSGPSEILRGGAYGHLVPVGVVESLAQGILSVFSGDRRLPPPEWLEKYRLERVLDQYLQVLGV